MTLSTVSTFDYSAPEDLDGIAEAIRSAAGTVAVLGGGTMLVPDISHGNVRPDTVIDLARAGLAGVRAEGDSVVIGAMTTYRDVLASPVLREHVPLLPELASGVTGGPQIRNRGTVGGSASYANPSSDIPGALVALRARMRLLSPAGTREVPAAEFYTGPFRTARRDDEVLIEISVPRPSRTLFGYVKFKLATSSWPIVTAATLGEPDGGLRVAVGGAGRTPVTVRVPEPTDTDDADWRAHVRAAVDAELTAVGTWTDVLADGEYRRRIAPVVVARSVAKALRRNEEEQR